MDDSEPEGRRSARRLLGNLYAFTVSLERERNRHPGSLLCRINECSHFVRCAATELNEIADEGEINVARNGKKNEAWRGSFTLLLAKPPFCSAKGGFARLNTNDHVGSELSKVNAPIEQLFTWTSAVESEPHGDPARNSDALVIQFLSVHNLIVIYGFQDETFSMYSHSNDRVKQGLKSMNISYPRWLFPVYRRYDRYVR